MKSEPEITPEERAEARSIFCIEMARPEWFDDAIVSAIRTFELCRKDAMPHSIRAWMVVVSCMRVLRAIYGSDLNTVIKLREKVLRNVREDQKIGL